jgi:hypothetical protein
MRGLEVRKIFKRIQNRYCAFAFVLALGANFLFSGGPAQGSADPTTARILSDVLAKAADYGDRLNRIALYFTCLEEVTETVFEPFRLPFFTSGWKTRRHNDVYDYQLIRMADIEKIEERRFQVRSNAPKSPAAAVPLTTERFYYKTIVYGPLGLFGRQAQDLNTYALEKETTEIWGRKACVVKAAPKFPDKARWLYGRAWIDKETGGILKIEWDENSLFNYEEIQRIAENLNADPSLRFESQYEFEKNGIRFPSRYEVREDYRINNYHVFNKASDAAGRIINKSELTVVYRDYKFFTVETTIK